MTKITLSNQSEGDKEGKEPLYNDLESTTKVAHRKPFVAPSCIVIVTVFVILILTGIGLTTFSSIKLYKDQHTETIETVCTVIDGNSEPHQLKQQATVDVESQTENITVPKYDLGDRADFLHDFKRNISLIRVLNESVCYFMNLDRRRIPEPKSLVATLTAHLAGKYVISPETIHEFYSVEHEIKIKDISELYGESTSLLCGEKYKSYWLEKIPGESDQLTETTTFSLLSLLSGPQFYTGEEIIQYIINTRNYPMRVPDIQN